MAQSYIELSAVDCPASETLVAFLEGSLGDDERDALETHIDACEPCRVALSTSGPLAPAPPAGAAERDVVGRYQIREHLGEGSMGVVYRARDPDLQRDIALKLVRPRRDAAESELVRARTLREGQAIARISHPNVIAVYDVGTWRGAVFVAMELVDGVTLDRWLAERDRSPREIAAVFAHCAEGLAAAHAAGVVHRDFKPSNVLIGRDGRARVTDFGLAMAGEAAAPDATADDDGESLRLTRTGAVLGTPAYMAPEQHRGEATTEASDQFALCVALWEALHGERPFAGDTAAELASAIEAGHRRSPPRRAPRWLRRVALRGLAARAEARYPSVAALARALRPHRARWLAAGGAGLGVVGLALGIALAGGERDPCAGVEEALAPVWGAERRAAVADAFHAADLPYARESWAEITPRIDEFGARWRALRQEACRASRERGELSAATRERQVLCLSRRRQELDALLRRWQSGDEGALERAAASADTLPSLEACADRQALAERAPLPADPETRAELDALSERLASARAEHASGNYDGAAAAFAEIAEAADLPGAADLRASALFWRGLSQRELGAYDGSRQSLTRAVAAAETAGTDRLKVRAWIHLLEATAYDAAALEEARRILTLAEGALARLDDDPALAGKLAAAEGRLALRSGDASAAIEALERSLEVEDVPPLEASARRTDLASAHSAGGNYEAMLAELERAHELAKEAVGEEHPSIAAILNNKVEPLFRLGREEEARRALEASRRIIETTHGPESPKLAAVLDNLSILYASEGDHERALSVLKRALVIGEKTLGDDHVDLATTHLNLASVYKDTGQSAPAIEHYRRAGTIWEQALGEDHPDVARTLLGEAEVHLREGRPEPALPLAERALTIRESADPKHVQPDVLAHTRFALARVLRALGKDRRRARSLARAALAFYREHYPESESLDEVRRFLAAGE